LPDALLPKPDSRMTREADAVELTRQAVALHREGRLVDARRLYESALQLEPTAFEARHMLGVVTLQEGDIDKAIELLSGALALQPSSFDALCDAAYAMTESGRFDEALAHYDRAVGLRSDDTATLLLRANVKHSLGRNEEALADCEAAVRLRPDSADAWIAQGKAQLALDRHEVATGSLERALVLAPESIEALASLGGALARAGRFDEAIGCFDSVLAAHPDAVAIHNERGNALFELGRYPDAIGAYEKGLSPDAPNALLHSNRGISRFALHDYDGAIVDFDAALRLQPNNAKFHYGRATALAALKRDREAIESYAVALSLKADLPYALGYLAHGRALQCDWSEYETIVGQIARGVREGRPVTAPLTFLGISDEPDQQLACAESYVAAMRTPVSVPTVPVRRSHNRIRLAYLSANFNEHAVAYLVAEMFERHDRSRFELYGVSFGVDDGGPMLARIRDGFDHFVDVRSVPDADVAEALRANEIDIAIDLMAHTNEARAGILAHRAAPVQVNFLGYPGTMGGRFLDYIIADNFIIPPGEDRFYSECVVRMPDTYQPNDRERRIAERTPGRAELGLPEEGFVFCCFNNSFKLSPPLFDVWMRVLRQVDGSVLWLLEANEAVRANLQREAEKRGIPAERLIFAPRAPLDAHLARHRAADLFIDSMPYNAHTTASDALWAGLPIVTCAGRTFASRVAGSLLHAVGLPELVTQRLDEYETLAVALALAPGELRALRHRLEQRGHASPLFDTDRFCRHLERAYRTMWEIHRRGEPPRAIEVPQLVSRSSH
jgi:predicted O-linked N-acetylglucosamine transferase (SPINDLY family)